MLLASVNTLLFDSNSCVYVKPSTDTLRTICRLTARSRHDSRPTPSKTTIRADQPGSASSANSCSKLACGAAATAASSLPAALAAGEVEVGAASTARNCPERRLREWSTTWSATATAGGNVRGARLDRDTGSGVHVGEESALASKLRAAGVISSGELRGPAVGPGGVTNSGAPGAGVTPTSADARGLGVASAPRKLDELHMPDERVEAAACSASPGTGASAGFERRRRLLGEPE